MLVFGRVPAFLKVPSPLVIPTLEAIDWWIWTWWLWCRSTNAVPNTAGCGHRCLSTGGINDVCINVPILGTGWEGTYHPSAIEVGRADFPGISPDEVNAMVAVKTGELVPFNGELNLWWKHAWSPVTWDAVWFVKLWEGAMVGGMCYQDAVQVYHKQFAGWWFQKISMFTPIWGNDPIWLMFFKWVETTNSL